MIIGLREGGFSYRAVGACVERKSSTMMRVWKQWTDEHRTTRKTASGRRKVTLARDDRHLLRMAMMTLQLPPGSWQHVGILLQCVIDQHTGLTPGVMVWGKISYHGRSNLLRIKDNLNINTYDREVLQPKVVPFHQDMPGALFQQDNARPHVAKTVQDFC
ncbi:transposable element Tc1 transposase [Trichonephila clavipes]|nr:transposable element Tc1 transposase [Trichonephila clavipes]